MKMKILRKGQSSGDTAILASMTIFVVVLFYLQSLTVGTNIVSPLSGNFQNNTTVGFNSSSTVTQQSFSLLSLFNLSSPLGWFNSIVVTIYSIIGAYLLIRIIRGV